MGEEAPGAGLVSVASCKVDVLEQLSGMNCRISGHSESCCGSLHSERSSFLRLSFSASLAVLHLAVRLAARFSAALILGFRIVRARFRGEAG